MLRPQFARIKLTPIRRCLHASRPALEDAPTAAAAASSEAKIYTDREMAVNRAVAWFKSSEAEKYRKASRATFVGDGDRPFPMNPLFRPKAPIDNDTRNEIFKLYQQDPKTWTPRRLGDHFGLSIVRVQAILRLRAVASKWESEGKELEEGYRQGMETMLGAQKIKPDANLVPREPLRFTTARRLQPFFRMMNEEEAFTAEDAAALMQLEPYQNLQRKLDLAANRAFSMTPPKQDKDHAAPTVKKDEGQKSRFKFMVVDTSNPRRKELTIRERNGDIRSATVEEKFQRKNAKPTFIM